MNRSRLAATLATVAAVTLVLAGCGLRTYDNTTPEPAESRGPSTVNIPVGYEEYYTQELDWEECDDATSTQFDCTTVTAPLDWADPDGDEIELAVIRRGADSGDPVGSLLTNPGGPGASGYDLIHDSVEFAVGDALADHFDVIGFDPRGVGRSTAVACLTARQMDAFLYDIPADPRGSAGWEAELTTRAETFADACEANSDGILPYITTENSARDMDLLRGVLGDDKLNYLGYSYGTFLGATYAKLFPENTGRLVLDGAIDPSVSGIDVGTTQALGFESALSAYMTDCLAGDDCPFTGTLDQAMADLSTLLASVDSTPLKNSDGRLLGADTLITAIVTAMYAEDSWPYLTMALTDALQGDPSVAFLLADSYNGRETDGQYADNSTEAFQAYNCVDYPEENDPAAQDAATALIEEKAPTFAPYWDGVDVCASWTTPPTGVREAITADGAAPIVVVGTTNDPATPYEWSVSLADQLSSGTLITRVGEGHTGFNKGNACVDDAVEAYLIDGTVPEPDLTCN